MIFIVYWCYISLPFHVKSVFHNSWNFQISWVAYQWIHHEKHLDYFMGIIFMNEKSSNAWTRCCATTEKQKQEWQPVAYASRTMSETETRYAQIEKEALAITWSCEKFPTDILGKHISINTDHKPLVTLLGSKHLVNLPPRVLRICLILMWFSYSIQYVPGKLLYTADTLSRAPLTETIWGRVVY